MRRCETTPPPIVKKNGTLASITKNYEVITPIFGGGAKPQQVDADCPIRAASLRGLLRFWWRATRGGNYATLAELREAEKSLWGSTEKPSQVSLDVEILQMGSPKCPRDMSIRQWNDKTVPMYAAFPIIDSHGDPLNNLHEGVEFRLTLRFPESYREDIEAALWALECFGGIGARTRRGFGAIHCKDCNLQNRQAWIQYIEEGAQKYVAIKYQHPGVPSLQGIQRCFRIIERETSVKGAWEKAIDNYKAYRQNRRLGNGPKPGRSYWPEPDVLRRISNQRDPMHTELPENKGITKFPRAAFGLPIIFHFQSQRDPRDFTLQGFPDKAKGIDRLASPLLLRPIKTANGALSLAAVLTHSFANDKDLIPGGLHLKERTDATIGHQLSSEECQQLKNKPTHQPNVLHDFLEQFR